MDGKARSGSRDRRKQKGMSDTGRSLCNVRMKRSKEE